jgi:hypothetical protein
MPKELVEPTVEVAKESTIAPGAAQAATEADQGGSALDTLKASLSVMKPATVEPTAAQLAYQEVAKPEGESAQPVKKETVKSKGAAAPQDPTEPRTNVAKEASLEKQEEGALEEFRKGLRRQQRAKQKALEDAPVTEEKKDTPADSTPTDTTTTAHDDSPVTDEEIAKDLAEGSDISKKHRKRMMFLANRAKELEEKLKAAEATPKTDDSAAKIKEAEERANAAQAELIKYRRRYSLESEPEIKKFDEIAKTADQSILGKLKDAGLSDQTIKLIEGMGGFDGFSRSSQTFTINERDPDGEVVPRVVTAAYLAKKWLGDMNVGDAEYIRAKMSERYTALDTKKQREQELLADANKWFEEQQKAQQQAVEKHQHAIQENISKYQKWADEWAKKQDWLKDVDPGANATEEEKKQAEAVNRHNSGVRQLLKSAATPGTVEDYTALVEQAANAQHHRRESERLSKQVASLQEELKRIRAGLSTTKAGGGSIPKAAPKKADDSPAAQLQTPVVDSLREAMEQMRDARGNE